MKRNLIYVLSVLLISAASCSFTTKTFDNPDKDKLLISLLSYVLEKAHFDPKTIDDDFSKEVFANYLERLDPLKRYFLQSDIQEFKTYQYKIDDFLKTEDLTFFNITYTRLQERMQQSKSIYQSVLETPFDYDKKEFFNADYKAHTYAKNKKGLEKKWRKQLKYSTLSTYSSEIEDLEKKDSLASVSLKDIEKKARKSTLKTLEEYYDFMKDLDRDDWFSMYLNAVVEEFDPHTFYFAPEDKERFDTSMSGKFEGIGARLQKKSDKITIVEVISGGPVWRGKLLSVGDEILKVGQNTKDPVNIVGMRLDDAVKLIKGPKGSEVRLTIKRVDGSIEVVPVIRDVVELEETYAKSSIMHRNGQKFGLINLPKFYINFNDYNQRNAASDVAKELASLKAQGIKGLVLDLRDNGGGSLKTVVDMAGLFIKQGPIVQVKTTGKRKEVLKDTDPAIQWDGPLVVLVNELSASASEILAAAMQDYKRAIVLGSKQTFGKGTVQNIFDLNQFLKNNQYGDVGALKITTQKFYRINGGSTQLEGVKSDIVVPDRYSYIDIGEKDQENPLAWDKIDQAQYELWQGDLDYKNTVANSKARMQGNTQIQKIEDNARWLKAQRDKKEFSLQYKTYKEELLEDKKVIDAFKNATDYSSSLTFSSLPYEISQMKKDTILKEKRSRWHDALAKDVYIEEAVYVLEDLKKIASKNHSNRVK